jgi:predicted nuclease of predicted toxin-antitoxin system
MHFLVDECTGPGVARWLREQQHDVFSVYEQARGAGDDLILQQAYAENRILTTNDKDFGERVFRDRMAHRGILLLRLGDQRTENKIAVLQQVLARYASRLADHFVVVTERVVRIVGPE